MKLQLHIGTHKTGTTAIQTYLYAHRKQLNRQGILYPQCCKEVGEQQFSFIATFLRNDDIKSAQDYIQKIKVEALNKEALLVVLSGEDFSLLDKAKVAVLAKLLAEFDVEIVIYFRNIYDQLISTFAQINRFYKVLPAWNHLGDRLHELIDYDEILTKWCDVFGSSKVSAHSYDSNKANLIEHFLGNLRTSDELHHSLFKTIDAPRFTNSNAKFDPVFEFFLMLIGYSNDNDDFKRARNIYKNHFGDLTFTRDTQLILARAFWQSRKLTLKHPKLASFRKELRPTLSIEENVSDTDVGEYMITLGKVIAELGHAKKRDDYKVVRTWRVWIKQTKLKIKRLFFRYN